MLVVYHKPQTAHVANTCKLHRMWSGKYLGQVMDTLEWNVTNAKSSNKNEKQKYQTIRTAQYPIAKLTESEGKIDTSNTYIHAPILSWIATDTSIKRDWVKLLLWPKMYLSMKCYGHADVFQCMMYPFVVSQVYF